FVCRPADTLVCAIERPRGESATTRHCFRGGGDIGITRIIRAQANFVEYVPLAPFVDGISGSQSLFNLSTARAWRDPGRGAGLPWPGALFWLVSPLWSCQRRSPNVGRAVHRSRSLFIPRFQGSMALVAVSCSSPHSPI